MCAMPRRSATWRIAASGTQPPACSWARHSSGITAEACRPSGYLAICPFAHSRFSAVKAKSLGCRCGSARRRTAITPSLSLDGPAARGFAGLQQHRAPHDGALLLQEEEQELPAAALDVDDVVTLQQIVGHGRLFLRRRLRKGGAPEQRGR